VTLADGGNHRIEFFLPIFFTVAVEIIKKQTLQWYQTENIEI